MMIRPVFFALLIPAWIISHDRVVDINYGNPIQLGQRFHIEAAVHTISPIAGHFIYKRKVTESANFFLALAHQQKQTDTNGRPVNMVQRCGAFTHHFSPDPDTCLYEFSYIQNVTLREANLTKSKTSGFFDQRFVEHVYVPQVRLYVAEFQRIFFNAITVNFIVILSLLIAMKVKSLFSEKQVDVLPYTRWRFRRIGIPVLVVCTWVFKHMYVDINGLPFPENPTEQVVDNKFIYLTMFFSDHVLTTLVCYVLLFIPFKFVADRMNQENVNRQEENPFT